MNTTPHTDLVRASWAVVRLTGPAFAASFYNRLFVLDPSLKGLFKGDMTSQQLRLAAMLDTAVGLLDHPAELLPALRNLGRRHGGYGVKDAHHAVVGRALLDTLARTLGDAYTPNVHAAWAETYGLIAQVMTEAARAPEAAPERAPLPRMAATAAVALVMAGAAAMPVQAQQVGWHPATAARPQVMAAIDANTFIVGHPASPTTRGGHANAEHPAVQVARGGGRTGIDPQTFIVQPPVAVTWTETPVTDEATRFAGAAPARATGMR